MKHAPIRHRLEYGGYRLLTGFLRRKGLDEVHSLGRKLGRLWRLIDSRHRRIADHNLRLVFPDLDASSRARIISGCYEHFGVAFSELFAVARMSEKEILDRVVFEGWENIELLRKEGRGILISCGHYGNWQFAVWPIALRLGNLHVVARTPDNPLVAADVGSLRCRYGVQSLDRRGVGLRVFHLIRKGNAVGMVIDQRIRPRDRGLTIPFLGHPARTTSIPAFILARSGGAAIHMRCVLEHDGRYRISFSEAIEADPKDDLEVLAARLLEPIEDDIRKAPQYWLWMHRRWIMNSAPGPPPRIHPVPAGPATHPKTFSRGVRRDR